MLTDLKVSPFACKYVFYRPEHNTRRGLHKTEFWKSWNAKNEITNRYSSKSRRKMGPFCLVIMVIS